MNPPAPRPARRIFIVEDTEPVATLIEALIEDLGWTVAGPATTLADALAAARDTAIDAAIIDVNLAGEASWEVAAILRDRGVPFLFTTGYGDAAALPPNLAGSPVLGKPFQMADLEHWLRSAVPDA
jgi:CheY-like chemotaxis protein